MEIDMPNTDFRMQFRGWSTFPPEFEFWKGPGPTLGQLLVDFWSTFGAQAGPTLAHFGTERLYRETLQRESRERRTGFILDTENTRKAMNLS